MEWSRGACRVWSGRRQGEGQKERRQMERGREITNSSANADAAVAAAAFEENFLDALATLCLVAKEAAA